MKFTEVIKVLVVDDEEIIRTLLTRTLTIAGCEVLLAKDGLEGLEVLGSEKVDVLISDIKMPKMDGIAMVREALTTRPHLPVLMITGYAESDALKAVKALGVVDTIIKPFRNNAIISSINKALMHRARVAVEMKKKKLAAEENKAAKSPKAPK